MLRDWRSGGTCLPSYRLYRLDGAGRINNAEWVDAADDEDARSKAHAFCPSGRFELWERKRRVHPSDAGARA